MSRASQHPSERDRPGLQMALAALERRERIYPGAAGIPRLLLEQISNPYTVLEPSYDALQAERDQLRAQVEEQLPRLIDENHKLRAELDAIRGQDVSLPEPCLNELYSEQFRSGWNMCLGVMRHNNPQLRKQDWCSTMERPKAQCGCPDCGSSLVEVNGLQPHQPDAVSVPRELLDRVEKLFPADMEDDGSGRAGFYPHVREAVQELRALLSTRQAEEGE